MKLKKFISAVLVAGMMTAPGVALADEPSEEYVTYDNILNFIEKSYIDENVTKEMLLQEAISNYLEDNPERMVEFLKATFDGLDEYSQFYTMQEFMEFIDGVNNVSYGLGVIIQERDGYVTVNTCIEGGGAIKAGIQPGDKIVKVDGKDVVGLSMEAVRSYVMGERYTEVKVTVLRGNEEIEYTVIRDAVKNDTVNYGILDGNIGYVSIITFADTTAEEFASALELFDSEGVTNIVMDLRNNGGGLTDAAISIAQMIVPKGIIITLEHRMEEKSRVYTSTLENPPYKFAVLVNENTASASEVLASAMGESGIATLVGETTYGKAVAQEAFVLADAYGGVKLTTAHYLTRNGNEINGVGITPDEFILNEKRPVDTSKYTPFDYKQVYSVGMTASAVKAAEERLDKMGYSVGEVDEVFTTETENAIYRFQEETGLYPYGVLDITTQVKINNKFYEMTEVLDKQFDRAYELMGGVIEE